MPHPAARAQPADDAPPAKLGARLREARRAQRKTLAQVADQSRLTKGFVSKLENDQTSASVASLVRLCEALAIPVGSLFESAVGEVVRRSAYPPIAFGGTGMREFLLTPQSERRIQAILSEIEPEGGSGQARYVLPTEVEFVFVLAGELEIDLAGEPLILTPGDSLTFPASTEHAFRAIGPDSVRVLWIITPALPDQGWRRPDAATSPEDTTPHSNTEPR